MSESTVEKPQTIETQAKAGETNTSEPDVYVPPPRKGVVQRCFHRKTKSKGQSARVTVFYEYNRDYKLLKYGAVIVIKDKRNKKLTIHEFEQSAKKRFMRDPVVVHGFKDHGSVKDFEDSVRKLLLTKGCKATKSQTTGPTGSTGSMGQ